MTGQAQKDHPVPSVIEKSFTKKCLQLFRVVSPCSTASRPNSKAFKSTATAMTTIRHASATILPANLKSCDRTGVQRQATVPKTGRRVITTTCRSMANCSTSCLHLLQVCSQHSRNGRRGANAKPKRPPPQPRLKLSQPNRLHPKLSQRTQPSPQPDLLRCLLERPRTSR
jgi:hypothetical protein